MWEGREEECIHGREVDEGMETESGKPEKEFIVKIKA